MTENRGLSSSDYPQMLVGVVGKDAMGSFGQSWAIYGWIAI